MPSLKVGRTTVRMRCQADGLGILFAASNVMCMARRCATAVDLFASIPPVGRNDGTQNGAQKWHICLSPQHHRLRSGCQIMARPVPLRPSTPRLSSQHCASSGLCGCSLEPPLALARLFPSLPSVSVFLAEWTDTRHTPLPPRQPDNMAAVRCRPGQRPMARAQRSRIFPEHFFSSLGRSHLLAPAMPGWSSSLPVAVPDQSVLYFDECNLTRTGGAFSRRRPDKSPGRTRLTPPCTAVSPLSLPLPYHGKFTPLPLLIFLCSSARFKKKASCGARPSFCL